MIKRLFATTAVFLLIASAAAVAAVGGSGTVDPPPRIAFLANGINPADALAAGGIAGQLGAPLFTTDPATLSAPTAEALVAYAPELVIVLGGPVAVTDGVMLAVSEATGLAVQPDGTPTDGIVRVAGENRYATAAAVAELLAAYAPAYLPVGATALGAADAEDADLLDGIDSATFLTEAEGNIRFQPRGELPTFVSTFTPSAAVTSQDYSPLVETYLELPETECEFGSPLHDLHVVVDSVVELDGYGFTLDVAVNDVSKASRTFSGPVDGGRTLTPGLSRVVQGVVPGPTTVRLSGASGGNGFDLKDVQLTVEHVGVVCDEGGDR